LNPLKLEQMKRDLAGVEARIASTEEEIAALEGKLAVFRGAEETQRVSAALADKRAELERLTEKWEELSVSVEEAS
jgi:septal ring factor EnvC (AmiA/AmiB activator)